ncbi:hypothetical protein [Vibrio coralliilyticus]|uniref:hypothetical protein n=1 Tax=Vibrio coralliilyticus TaxID=190893 RepID=UPI002FD1D9C3
MLEKVNGWLDIAERIFNLIRPKAYNTIAKTVVFTGIALIVESQVNFLHALVVALFEEYIGKSEILRSVLDVSSDPTIGVVLVVTGMVYHLVAALGKDFIDTKKAELPKYPIFEFFFDTQLNESQSNGEIYLDGPDYTFEQWQNIPDYEEPSKEPNEESEMSRTLRELTNSVPTLYPGQRQHKVRVNKKLYSDRAELLKEWLGYEPLKLSLYNDGEVLANGVKVQLTIPKDKGVSIKERGSELPKRPVKYYSTMPHFVAVRDEFKSILSHQAKVRLYEEDDHYKIIWDKEPQQAGVVSTAGKDLLFKISNPVEVECTIFCDELTRPANLTITLFPAQKSKSLELDDITNDEKFEELYSKIVKTFDDGL